jgi:chromate transporter
MGATKTSLTTLAGLFLRLGATAFGGPAAHIAMMQNEVVRRRAWMTEQEFLDLISACNLIPGPNSTEMAIHIGHRQAGWAGLLVAGICFIVPAAAIVLGIAWIYVGCAQLPAVSRVMDGIKPVIIAIIVQALLSLSKSALKSPFLKIMAAIIFSACFFSNNEIGLLLGGGIASLLWSAGNRQEPIGKPRTVVLVLLTLLVLVFAAGSLQFHPNQIAGSETGSAHALVPYSPSRLFWYFVKIGSVLYGSGYVLLAFLRADLVQQWHWLTSAQLLDATAVGQVTPGPVFTTATFIGYLLGNAEGAFLATIGIFLPAFFFVAVTAPFVQRVRGSKIAGATLDGVNVASLALMAFVTFELGKDFLSQPLFVVESLTATFLLCKYTINPTWLILGGALIGLITQFLS